MGSDLQIVVFSAVEAKLPLVKPISLLIATGLFFAFEIADQSSSAASDTKSPENSWPQFRGPGARGVASGANLPEHWSATENVAWKAEIPGRGWSSPIVSGDHVFLTTAISSGQVEQPKKGLYFGGERKDAPRVEHEWKLLCLDLKSGKIE